MATVTLEWDGKPYEVDIESITPKEFRAIKSHLGLKAGGFIRSFENLDDMDADAIVALLWLGEKRAGNPAPAWRDDVPWLELLPALKGIEKDTDDAAETEEDPANPKAGSETSP